MVISLHIRPLNRTDLDAVTNLFYQTVHRINRRDYTQAACQAWAPDTVMSSLRAQLQQNHCLVAYHGATLVGFADLCATPHLNCLYIHHHYQRQGIAKQLLKRIESQAKQRGNTTLTTEASLTALPFFLAQDWVVLKQQTVIRHQQSLTNFCMIKNLFPLSCHLVKTQNCDHLGFILSLSSAQ